MDAIDYIEDEKYEGIHLDSGERYFLKRVLLEQNVKEDLRDLDNLIIIERILAECDSVSSKDYLSRIFIDTSRKYEKYVRDTTDYYLTSAGLPQLTEETRTGD